MFDNFSNFCSAFSAPLHIEKSWKMAKKIMKNQLNGSSQRAKTEYVTEFRLVGYLTPSLISHLIFTDQTPAQIVGWNHLYQFLHQRKNIGSSTTTFTIHTVSQNFNKNAIIFPSRQQCNIPQRLKSTFLENGVGPE